MTGQMQVGAWYIHRANRVRLLRLPNLREAQVRGEDGLVRLVPLHELRPVPAALPEIPALPVDTAAYKKALKDAEERLVILEPLLRLGPARTRTHVLARAEEFGLSPATIYRWLRQYEQGKSVAALFRRPRSDAGRGRLPKEVVLLMDALIEREYLTPERPSMTTVYTSLKSEVDRANRTRAPLEVELPLPSLQTFRNRIYQVSERRRVSRRYGHRMAEALDPILGHYPGATYPLAVVQIDHTMIDLELVDNVHRLPIGRPWITLVMDVFSRVVLGFYISFDAPSAFSAGMALTHAILPKELWLARHQEALSKVLSSLEADLGPGVVEAKAADLHWPCWGKPVLVKMDNAKEFRGKVLERAMRWHDIDREFRPVLKPRYGGHVERILGTFAREIHTLPGTTFSNPRDRGEYDSEGRAALTLDAFETWLTALIVGVYHQREHSSLGKSPLQAWEDGLLLGTEDHPPTGVPEPLGGDAANRLRMDFLPFFEKSVKRAGVRHDGVIYENALLRRYSGAKHPDYPTRARTFYFSYDPRDISAVYFLDPDLNRYFEVRCKQPDFPSMSQWELRATKRFAKQNKVVLNNERDIMNTFRLMRRLVEEEKVQTKSVRSEAVKQARRAKAEKPAGAVPPAPPSADRSALSLFTRVKDLKPFEDIE